MRGRGKWGSRSSLHHPPERGKHVEARPRPRPEGGQRALKYHRVKSMCTRKI